MAGGDQLERLWASLSGLGPRRLMALAGVGLAVFLIVGFGSYYLSRPDLEVLYVGLAPPEVARMGVVLHEAGVPFDVNAEATKVLVKRGEAARARMLLAERGLPNSATAGYELFDKLGSMGLTSFMQNITRLRALEGEIARTIQAMKGVKAARVHLVLPDPGSFRREAQPPSASVVIRTETSQAPSAAAIRQIVSAAVPGMKPDSVAVLNTDGTVLAAGGEAAGATSGKMLDLEKQVSHEIADNIRKTLTPVLGLGNYETSVSTRLNLDKKETSETAFDPESKVERSTRTLKENSNSQNSNSKWNVSVEQNIPAEQGSNKPTDQSKRSSEKKEETTNFELSSKTTTTISDGYRIENIAVAVVVNRKPLLASAGGDKAPAVDEQIKSIEKLVASAAGLQPSRGDKATVVAVDFAPGTDLEPVAVPMTIWDRLATQTGSYVLAAAVLLSTILFISLGLRPSLRMILDENKPALEGPAALTADGQLVSLPAEGLEAQGELAVQATMPASAGPRKQSSMKLVEQAIAENEEQAAEVLKQWIREG
jgi:flagellar M-ring protein FliF